MADVRAWLSSPRGKRVAVSLVATGIALGVIVLLHPWQSSQAVALSQERLFICSQTGKSFTAQIAPGSRWPVRSRYSDKNTGYPAELCSWTADGHVRSRPTVVLLARYMGKPGPTFCPECGRLVQPHNPPAAEGFPPPPTRAQYAQWRASQQEE